MRVLRAANYRAAPWKNSLGTTREILRYPPGAADFVYRLSLADVTESCDFSAFPGYDRIITLIDGDGFELQFADGRTHALTTPHVPFRFDGGAPVSCAVAGGPSRDLNLMVRRDAAKVESGILTVVGRLVLPPVPGATRLIVVLTEAITARSGGQTAELGRWDTACMDATGAPADETICTSAGSALLFHAIVMPRAGQDLGRGR